MSGIGAGNTAGKSSSADDSRPADAPEPLVFAGWLGWLAWLILLGGWIIAVVAFLVIGTETCTKVEVPLAPVIEACQDTTAQSVILLTVMGFGATLGALFLWTFRYLLLLLLEISGNTRRRGPGDR